MEETLGILNIRSPHSAGFHLHIIGQRGAVTIPQMICSLWVGHQQEGWQAHSIQWVKTPLRIVFWPAQGSSRLDLPGGGGSGNRKRARANRKTYKQGQNFDEGGRMTETFGRWATFWNILLFYGRKKMARKLHWDRSFTRAVVAFGECLQWGR